MAVEDQRPWLMLAVLSGACAAFNGVFAKLTTTALTASWARGAASMLHVSPSSRSLEYAIRTLFFALNMTFNGIMWGLFTRALALSPSAIRVNVINTASNFLITAVMGYLVFEEHLPPLWFVGAGMLVAGSVIIGARDGREPKRDLKAADTRGADNDQNDSKSVPTAAGGLFEEVQNKVKRRNLPNNGASRR